MRFVVDGGCVRRAGTATVAAVAMVGLVFSGTGLAHADKVPAAGRARQIAPDPQVRIIKTVRNFGTCAAAAAALGSRQVGDARFGYRSDPGTPRLEENSIGVWGATSQGRVRFLPRRSVINMTIPRWPHMTDADKAAVNNYEASLLTHEQGLMKGLIGGIALALALALAVIGVLPLVAS